MKLILCIIFELTFVGFAISQNLPTDKNTNEIVYTDLILFDTLNPDTAFIHMINALNKYPKKNKNLQSDNKKLLITFTTINTSYSKFPDEFGEIECDVVIRYFPNKFAYRITNFQHVPVDNYPPCINNLNVIRPKCFEGKPYEKYWKNVKQCAIYSMNDFIMNLFFVSLENQPTRKTIKIDNYFLARNRN